MTGTLLLLLVAMLASCAPLPPAPERPGALLEIVAFWPPAGELSPGDTALSTLDVRSLAAEPRTLWIGYSVGDPAGGWHDVPARRVDLEPRASSGPLELAWALPAGAQLPAGGYRVIMAAWDGPPGSPGATRLAVVDRADAFRVSSTAPPILFGGVSWRAGDHALGRGRVRPGQVAAGDPMRLRLAPAQCDGAEIRTDARHRAGRFSARIRTPFTPGSLSGFFLYEDVTGGNDEIDIEIYNDGSRRVLLSTWVAGEMTNHAERTLPFDPAGADHAYTIEWGESFVRFLADGAPLEEFTTRLPTKAMRLMTNVWWPTWLGCDGGGAGGELLIREISISG